MMKKLLFALCIIPSLCLAANDDIADRPELGTATNTDSILTVNAGNTAGDRLSRLIFPGAAGYVLSGAGTWLAMDTDLSTVSANDDTLPSAKATKAALDLKDDSTPSTLNLTTDTSISAAQFLANKFITNQGSSAEVDITLPAVSYTISRTIIVQEAQIVEVGPPTGEILDLSGTLLDANDVVDSPATVGSKMVVTRMQNAAGTWHYSLDVVRGSWVDSGASD